MHIKRLECKVLIRGDKDYKRRSCLIDLRYHTESVQLRHLNIKKDQIRLQAANGFDGFPTIGGRTDNFNIGLAAKESAQ